ncbi:hypothetical protein JOQ06_003877 [Pogonophryne albipinna]|uniref:SH3 domain-containing protein n=1 Tax=Pogonophryne albipinna TaxID=1090488 RepID=A0AAD6F7W3_9TELE|nr:hypothetical protein JOQ06_003877 [Pogonophryne albipinna]
MWKSVVGHNVNVKVSTEGEDWETDPDFENDISEQEQRWGAKSVEGSGRQEHISIADLRNKVVAEHEQGKKKEHTPKASYGYGGKFGVEKDRMDKVALGNDYVAQVEQHSSQKDGAQGFGGKYGVQKDRVDKSAMGFEYKGEVQQHTSQKDYSKGFGGKYGVEKEKMDKAALGYDYKGETEKHQSQKDYSKGFGGKFGVEKEKVDKAALGYDYKSETEKHQSQKDYSAGFGGRYGVQADRMDKSAVGFSDMDSPSSAYEKTQPLEASSAGAGKLKAHKRRRAEERRKSVHHLFQMWLQRWRMKCRHQISNTTCQRYKKYLNQNQRRNQCTRSPRSCPRAQRIPTPWRPTHPQTSDDNDYEDLSTGQTAVAIYDYEGEAGDEISFNPDDVITNIEMIDEGWWKGHCRGRVGLFPAAYVQLS